MKTPQDLKKDSSSYIYIPTFTAAVHKSPKCDNA